MQNHLKNKVVVVTGAAGGFGRLVALRCLELGAMVARCDINETELKNSKEDFTQYSKNLLDFKADVTILTQMQELMVKTINKFGRIDVLINNAGTMPLAFYSDHIKATKPWDNCIDINIKGVLNGIISAYDQMILQGNGHVVNISSIYGNYPVAGAGVYGATKAAVNFLSESLRVESQGKIKVTIIKPTGVRGTGLGAGIINEDAIIGILGQNSLNYLKMMDDYDAGVLPAKNSDANDIEYYALSPEHLADQIVYSINQPLGVAIADLTVRASGEGYIL
jgi:NADP-dependent 3-hydroxy acid dehydrogenase YdfG